MLSNRSNPFGNIMDYVEQAVKPLWHNFGQNQAIFGGGLPGKAME